MASLSLCAASPEDSLRGFDRWLGTCPGSSRQSRCYLSLIALISGPHVFSTRSCLMPFISVLKVKECVLQGSCSSSGPAFPSLCACPSLAVSSPCCAVTPGCKWLPVFYVSYQRNSYKKPPGRYLLTLSAVISVTDVCFMFKSDLQGLHRILNVSSSSSGMFTQVECSIFFILWQFYWMLGDVKNDKPVCTGCSCNI